MPLFEYQCQECDAKIEVIQRVGARALKKTECDDCGVVRPVKKLLSAPAFQFKGEGWYVTDYADKKKTESKSDAGSSDGDSKSPSDTKPAKDGKSAKDAGDSSSDSSSGSKSKTKDTGGKSSSQGSSSSKSKKN